MTYNFDEIINRENTDSVKYDIRDKYFGKKDVIPMWVADMDFRTPQFISKAIQERANHKIYGYSIKPAGFYDSIAGWLHRRHAWSIKKDWIIFSPGVVPAVNLAIQTYTEPGDEIIVQPPVYFPFFSSVKHNKRSLVYNELKLTNGRYEMDIEGLKNSITTKTKMLILCSPHNPCGNLWTKKELLRLAQICMEHNILLVSDEIHADLTYPGYKHIPTASISDEIAENTVTFMAPSKTFNLAGLSTSFVVISNDQLRRKFLQTIKKIHIESGNLFGNIALEAAYTHGDDYVDALMEYLKGNLDFLESYINAHIPQINVIRPEATYLVWLDCTALGFNDRELKEFIIHKAGLGLSDGPIFGPGGSGFQRINIACPRKILETALEQLKKAIEK
jgi:cystathionine beta-lyase